MENKKEQLSLNKKVILQKLITLGELAASISHELKNLLISITGYCDLIEEKLKDGADITQEIQNIKKTSLMSQKLFMEFLQFARGKDDEAEKKPQNINEIVEEALFMVKNIKHITFEKELDAKISPFPMHRQKIKQVLLNILLNGVQAIGDKAGKIQIKTKLLEFPFGFYVSIADSGCGMDKETLKNIFQPFFTTKEKGTGLGLSVCYEIMSEHNGYIYVESEKGKGTTFSIVFLYSRFKPHKDIIDL